MFALFLSNQKVRKKIDSTDGRYPDQFCCRSVPIIFYFTEIYTSYQIHDLMSILK
jgi:hypothetical protein